MHNDGNTAGKPAGSTESGQTVPGNVAPRTEELTASPRPKKVRKKRKVFSCESCRKYKTRCDFEPLTMKCHRCNVLKIDCTLTQERENDLVMAISDLPTHGSGSRVESSGNLGVSDSPLPKRPATSQINDRLDLLEEKMSSLSDKLDLLLMLAQGSSSATQAVKDLPAANTHVDSASPPEESNDNTTTALPPIAIPKLRDKSHPKEFYKLREPPLKIINDIDERLFPLTATSRQEAIDRELRPSAVARVNFQQFYTNNRSTCLELCKEFLVRSHFWIIPGGIKEVDDTYVHSHLFITSVFTIIAMSSSDNAKYGELQETLYPLVERLLTNTLTMFDKLTVHDIEAILYCCMFHISRKTKRHRQLKFNSMVLANFALFSLMNNVDFHKIKERVLVREEYDATDLYCLRVLNSLTACHLQYCIAHGSLAPQDRLLTEYNHLIAKYPQANFGDDIKLSEINLSEIVTSIFADFEHYFTEFAGACRRTLARQESPQYLTFPELDYWLRDWDELLSKDGGGVLLFTYDFYHVMLCRSFLSEFLERIRAQPRLLDSLMYTMREHTFSLLRGFLRLPPTLIRGAPILTTNQVVYACMTLSDYLHWFAPGEKQEILSICTRVYWHLNTIGEKLNEVTESVGKIIKHIITTAKSRANMGPFAPSFVDISTLKQGEGAEPAPVVKETSVQMAKETSVPIAPSEQSPLSVPPRSQSAAPFAMPDVDRFNSFEDFFQDFFTHLKPATQQMFPSTK